MNILGLETSTVVCAVGLHRDGENSIEHSITESHIHSEKLLTLVEQVLGDARLTVNDLSAIAVSKGPGSFTGLRIGMSTAKGLCTATGKPLVLIPTFDAVAASVAAQALEKQQLIVLADAKQGEFYIGQYSVGSGRIKATGTTGIISVRDLSGIIADSHNLCIVTDRIQDIRELVGSDIPMLDFYDHCRGAMIARMGLEQLQNGHVADIASCEPFYLKEFVVRSQQQREQMH